MITLTLAVIVNGDQMSTVNIVGLVLCLSGIVVHVILKATASREYKQIHYNPPRNIGTVAGSNIFFRQRPK